MKDDDFSESESWVYGPGISKPPPKEEDIKKAIAEEVEKRAREMFSKYGYAVPSGISHSMGVAFETVKNQLFKSWYIEEKKNQFTPKEVDDLN